MRVFATQMLVLGLVRWELSCDDSRPVGTHIISTKNGALGRQAAVSGSGVGDSCSQCSDLSWSVTGETEICGHLIQKKQIKLMNMSSR